MESQKSQLDAAVAAVQGGAEPSHEVVSRIAACLRTICALPPSEASEVFRTLTTEQKTALARVAHAAFQQAVTQADAEALETGYLALAASYPLEDWREWTILASLLPRSAELIRADWEPIANSHKDIFPPAHRAFEELLRRLPEQSAAAMGWQERWTDVGFRFTHRSPRGLNMTPAELAEFFRSKVKD